MVKEKLQEKKENGLLTVEEAARYLNVNVSWLRQVVFRREINHIKVGALVRFREKGST
jgi:excisionase family DNA binding protein